jgi:hypothetical protein
MTFDTIDELLMTFITIKSEKMIIIHFKTLIKYI